MILSFYLFFFNPSLLKNAITRGPRKKNEKKIPLFRAYLSTSLSLIQSPSPSFFIVSPVLCSFCFIEYWRIFFFFPKKKGSWKEYRRYKQKNLFPIKEVEKNMALLKVGSKSNASAVAGALAGTIREEGKAELQAVGAGALNQAVKAVAIARGFIAPSGIDLICVPAFIDIDINGEQRTAIKILVEPRTK